LTRKTINVFWDVMLCSMVKLYDVFIGTGTSIIRVDEYVTCKKYGVCIYIYIYISKWSGPSQTSGGRNIWEEGNHMDLKWIISGKVRSNSR
jgi:hypothetical protein